MDGEGFWKGVLWGMGFRQASKKKKCKFCGRSVPADARFCPYCGRSLR
ncbi:MAG TPA: zinc-ribbon domain-containing protein [Nitrososphaeria archaeon]|nr:zinc-ribbon domain-containing protein [Nitrososphaeria archaeon]